jgi:DNA-binding MarR family transcriptional regulator
VPFVVNETGGLARAGLIEKRPAPDDRRKVDLVLTGGGRAAVAKAGPIQRDVNDVLFRSLDRRRFEALSRMTRDLLTSCDDALKQAAK